MKDLILLTEDLNNGIDLSVEDAKHSARLLGYDNILENEKINFLHALSAKGETADEVAAFASVFRTLALDPQLEDYAEIGIDVCGTGGDGFGTFNISTAVSFILASANVPVLKHGNRSITSKCGSADLMEAIGVKLSVEMAVHRKALKELNFTFFFAPFFHPVFKSIMPARKALAEKGFKTIFNLLGPMINPARPQHQLMGVYSKQWLSPIAHAMDALDLKRGLIVHGIPKEGSSLDEFSCAGLNYYKGFGSLSFLDGELHLDDIGLKPCTPNELKGGDLNYNIKLLRSFCSCDFKSIPSGLVNSIYLNSGAALLCVGKVDSLSEGIEVTRTIVEDGKLSEWLDNVKDFYSGI